MAKFKFSLKSVEKYRNVLLDEAKGRYAKAVADVSKQQEVILRIQNELDDINREVNLKNGQGISILELQGYKSYIKILDSNMKEEEYKLKSLKKIEHRRRMELVMAKTEALSIEKIKERRLAEHNKEETKKEELSIQEFVSNQLSKRS